MSFKSLGAVSYSPSIVTMAVSAAIFDARKKVVKIVLKLVSKDKLIEFYGLDTVSMSKRINWHTVFHVVMRVLLLLICHRPSLSLPMCFELHTAR